MSSFFGKGGPIGYEDEVVPDNSVDDNDWNTTSESQRGGVSDDPEDEYLKLFDS